MNDRHPGALCEAGPNAGLDSPLLASGSGAGCGRLGAVAWHSASLAGRDWPGRGAGLRGPETDETPLSADEAEIWNMAGKKMITIITIAIEHKAPIPDLLDKAIGRLYAIYGVDDVAASIQPTPDGFESIAAARGARMAQILRDVILEMKAA